MSERKHTPGPWSVLPIDDSTRPNAPFLIDAQGNKLIIAEVSEPNAAANAALIAEAPAMLAALRAILAECCLTHRRWGEHDNLKAANAAEESARAIVAKFEEE